MDVETLFTIGALARRTGLTVKTIRFYSDTGIVPPTDRSPGGYRLYDSGALARLNLVRTLRDLGLDLAVIRQVLDRKVSVPEVVATHADALEMQIRTLRLRRAALRAVTKLGSTPREKDLMAKLAKLFDDERQRLIANFIEDTFGGLDANADFVDIMRSVMPELPDDPEPDQVEAWVDLAELMHDTGFRTAVRRIAQYQAARHAEGHVTGLHYDLTETVCDSVGRALDAGIDPASAEAAPIIDALAARYAQTFDRADDADLRHWLLTRSEIAGDPQAERYWHLLAVINGWPVSPSLTSAFTWFKEALRAHTGQ
jgi:DNA-binding transcriptional MerR regulator